MLLYRLLDGRRVKRLWLGWLGSERIHCAFLLQCWLSRSWVAGSSVLGVLWKIAMGPVLRNETVSEATRRWKGMKYDACWVELGVRGHFTLFSGCIWCTGLALMWGYIIIWLSLRLCAQSVCFLLAWVGIGVPDNEVGCQLWMIAE